MRLVASQLDLALGKARALVDRLDFPSKDEFTAAASTAFRDVRAASASSWNLAYISLRPVFILLGILGHWLAIFLRVAAEHSVYHGWIAAKEGYSQLRTATVWFVGFQRDLPASAKYAELGALALLGVLWALRRHVRRYRYVDRISSWYRGKKRRALRKYHNFVERVARTSSFLALLLPHLMYAVLVIAAKRIAPSVVTHLATRTPLSSLIGFWHPLYLTFSVVGRLAPHLKEYREAQAAEGDETEQSTKTSRGRTMTPSRLKQQRQKEADMKVLRVEAVDLLKYWVVYAILLAMVRTGRLLPFVGHVLNATSVDNTSPATTGFFAKKAPGLYSKLRLSGKFVQEATLVFFVWLRMMPSSMTGDEAEEKKTSVSKANGSAAFDRHRPVDILYGRLSPIALSSMNASAFLAKRALGENRDDGSTFVSMAIEKFGTFLSVCVYMRLISKRTQEWLITTIAESSALLPAVTTLLMPSYFTSYGVVYVSLVVPSGYSASSCDAVRNSSERLEILLPKMDDASRYLQFWMVHAALSRLLESLAPLLAWVPLSTHVTWLLWAYVQLESTTLKIYGWFEGELGKSLEDTAIARSTRRFIAALPSNVEESSNGNDEGSNVGTTGEKTKVA